MPDDDLAKHGIRLAARPLDESEPPEKPSERPNETALVAFLRRTNRVCAYVCLGVGAAIFFTDFEPVGLAILFVAAALLLVEFENSLAGPPDRKTG